jgi:hypothetical protein
VSLLNPSPYGMCLERKSSFFGWFKNSKVGIGLCSKSGSKNWDFEFTDSKHVKLSSQGHCIVRGIFKVLVLPLYIKNLQNINFS